MFYFEARYKSMKNLSFVKKIILIVNYVTALLLFVAFVVSHLPAKILPILHIISLFFPHIVLANLLFVIYWLIQFKKYIFVSLFVLLLNYYNLQAIFQWSGNHPAEPDGFSIMSYNVRLFNAYHWIKEKGIAVDISNQVKDQFPNILLLQEYKNDKQTDFSQYKYRHIVLKGKKRKAGLAIFSKYKIVDKGNLNFSDTYNNAIWADILVKQDTIRIYNVHLQSYKIVNPGDLVEADKNVVRQKFEKVFKQQYLQAIQVQEHSKLTKHPVVIGGDFNNTAFSAPYRILKSGREDAFVTAGEGFGFTWRFKYIPMRIDFILPDSDRFGIENFTVLNYNRFSDHYPIKATLRIRE